MSKAASRNTDIFYGTGLGSVLNMTEGFPSVKATTSSLSPVQQLIHASDEKTPPPIPPKTRAFRKRLDALRQYSSEPPVNPGTKIPEPEEIAEDEETYSTMRMNGTMRMDTSSEKTEIPQWQEVAKNRPLLQVGMSPVEIDGIKEDEETIPISPPRVMQRHTDTHSYAFKPHPLHFTENGNGKPIAISRSAEQRKSSSPLPDLPPHSSLPTIPPRPTKKDDPFYGSGLVSPERPKHTKALNISSHTSPASKKLFAQISQYPIPRTPEDSDIASDAEKPQKSKREIFTFIGKPFFDKKSPDKDHQESSGHTSFWKKLDPRKLGKLLPNKKKKISVTAPCITEEESPLQDIQEFNAKASSQASDNSTSHQEEAVYTIILGKGGNEGTSRDKGKEKAETYSEEPRHLAIIEYVQYCLGSDITHELTRYEMQNGMLASLNDSESRALGQYIAHAYNYSDHSVSMDEAIAKGIRQFHMHHHDIQALIAIETRLPQYIMKAVLQEPVLHPVLSTDELPLPLFCGIETPEDMPIVAEEEEEKSLPLPSLALLGAPPIAPDMEKSTQSWVRKVESANDTAIQQNMFYKE